MKVSIVTPCKNSHEAVSRIVKYKNGFRLMPDNFEWIVVDHASDPPLSSIDIEPEFSMRFVYVSNPEPWILATLCNEGAKVAEGDFLCFWGIDSFPTYEWIQGAKSTKVEYAVFPRKQVMLFKDGAFILIGGEGYRSSRNWVSRPLFDFIGGFDTDFDGLCYEDSFFALSYMDKVKNAVKIVGAEIYCFPEKGHPCRPEFLHYEPKPEINKDKLRDMINAKTNRVKIEYVDLAHVKEAGSEKIRQANSQNVCFQ